jgi:ACS family hexuronate transporter-like MFS transporter
MHIDPHLGRRSSSWKWIVCGLLMLASAINYMDRQTLANAAVRITKEFELSNEQYGNVEAVFGYAFAAGSLVFGSIADRVAVKWLYVVVLAMWSSAGFATGFVENYEQLLVCRTLLGFFEAGHWPCALRTTRMLLDERERSLGNGLLQSGASLGAIVTPFVMLALMDPGELSTWRTPFLVVGAGGLFWLVPWLITMRGQDLRPEVASQSENLEGFWRILFSRKMLVVYFVVASINTAWQILRAWMPKFLQEDRAFSERGTLLYTSAWYVVTDVGCLAAGALAAWLARRYCSIHTARLLVFAGCSVLCAASVIVPWLGTGWLLLSVLALMGAGALGVFPLYYAFTQDISGVHLGKITGVAGAVAWLVTAQNHWLFGVIADQTGSQNTGLALAGLLPAFATLALWLFWNPRRV